MRRSMAEKILVVDDDPDIAKFIEVTLVTAGYEVAVAYDGQEALDAVSARRPDLVLLDIMLPTIDGFEVAHELRRRARLTGMAIIVVSALGLPEDRLRGLSLGVDDYIVKPFEPELLLARVRAALRRMHDMRSLSPLTGLPGTVLIEEEIRRCLDRGDPFALLYADLDHFKALNDTKGWDVGNQVILAAAQIVDAAVTRFAGSDGFVGHIGGDDFIFVIPSARIGDVCGEILSVFDTLIPLQYNDQDRRAGYFFGKDRRGQLHRVPLMTLSIGIVTNRNRKFAHPAQVSELATEMKSYAKTLPGSVFVVDRRHAPEGESPAGGEGRDKR